MAMARSKSKAGPGGKRPRKVRMGKRQSAKKRKETASRGQPNLAQAISPATSDRLGRPEVNGSRIRVQARLTEMLRVEMHNLDKVEALLRCLRMAMAYADFGTEGLVYYPDVVEVAADLAWRSNMDLQDLGEGRLVDRCWRWANRIGNGLLRLAGLFTRQRSAVLLRCGPASASLHWRSSHATRPRVRRAPATPRRDFDRRRSGILPCCGPATTSM
jgi:hypothetical protein